MKAIIAEKPSVAREIAALLGAHQKRDGYIGGNGYIVTWAFGHLVGLAMPDAYGVKGFQREALPILPNPFLLRVRQTKKRKSYVPDSGALRQLKIIEKVFHRSDSIIVATDAGREGELIFRFIYAYLNCKKPFERLWISSLTEKAIRRGFDTLRPGRDFDGLFHVAQARSRADWLVGINASQALSIAAGHGIYSLGRVQTPTLALICKRFLEHKDFKVQKYQLIKLRHTKGTDGFYSTSKTKWENKEKAVEALRSIQRSGRATVISVEQKEVVEQPPLLYDLTGLQKEANKKLNFTAAKTLQIAQRLYEKKFISYPRTGSKYIPEDLWKDVPLLVRALEVKPELKNTVEKIKFARFNKRIVNDLKVTEHHGLLITEKIPSALSADEDALYNMIALRLLEAVSQACKKEITDVTLQASHYEFSLKGCHIMEIGWRSIQGSFQEEDKEPLQKLPELKPGDQLPITKSELQEKKTKPPALYTEAGILSAMENAGRKLDNTQDRKTLSNIGIGTPATRAAIIETLFSRQYITKAKKTLLPTDKGLQVYKLVKNQKIADVALTARWESALQRIENGEMDANIFQQQITDYAALITKELLQMKISPAGSGIKCPKCRAHGLLIWEKVAKCADENCGWLQFRNICGVHLSLAQIEKLINSGKTALIKGMKSKSGKVFDAYIALGEDATTYFEFPNAKFNKVKS